MCSSDLAATVRDVFAIDCHFHCATLVPVHDSAVAINLYRIAQEAVTNAVKHSGAGHVLIELTRDADELVLIVSDDGRGLAAGAADTDGMGLRIMRHRARVIGAELAFVDDDASGLAVRLTLPLPAVAPMTEDAPSALHA